MLILLTMPAITLEPPMPPSDLRPVPCGKLTAPLSAHNGRITKSTTKHFRVLERKKLFCKTRAAVYRANSSSVSLTKRSSLHRSPCSDTVSYSLSSNAISYFNFLHNCTTFSNRSSYSLSKQFCNVTSSMLHRDVPTIGEQMNTLNGNGAVKTAEPASTLRSTPKKDEKLKPRSVLDYMEQVPEFLKPDNGPPRWFCPLESGCPPQDAPILLFLPGMDSTGVGLILHQQALGRMFEVRCWHIPVMDRTPFEGLLKIVEETIRNEHKQKPSKPLYIVGDSFGGLLALALAARNPNIDLVLILVNPATSFERSQLQQFFPLLDMLPDSIFSILPYMLSFTMGDPIRMAFAKLKDVSSPLERAQKLSNALVELLPTIPILTKVIPRGSLLWKLKLLHSGALYTNSRLHAVRAQVLLLISGKDQILPSTDEAKRLKSTIKNCEVRFFKDSGHTLLLELGLNLATMIKTTQFYRHSKVYDIVSDYVAPTKEEIDIVTDNIRIYHHITSPVYFSTHQNGRVQPGLLGIPPDQPLLLVGNHMLMGLELSLLTTEIFRELKQLVRGIAHPFLFGSRFQGEALVKDFNDLIKLYGAVPLSGRNLFKVLSKKQSVLLYPGGAREALHRKGEEYKLFWPKSQEFVRMAARHGTTIVPFSVVGEDDILELVADYDDFQRNPFLKDTFIINVPPIRPESDGEELNQPLYMPLLSPKVPGRLYFLFGRPIHTAGREKEFLDKDYAQLVYLQVKNEVESGLQYLIEKRNSDPYRNILPRLAYEASRGWTRQAPSFQP